MKLLDNKDGSVILSDKATYIKNDEIIFTQKEIQKLLTKIILLQRPILNLIK